MSWTEHGKGRKVGRCSVHSSGWSIEHCGHPTATYSWTASSPDGDLVVAWHGHGWRSLLTAKKHVEQAAAGERVLQRRGPTWDRGPDRLVRVVEMTDDEALALAHRLNDGPTVDTSRPPGRGDVGDVGCVAYVANGRIRFVGSEHGEHSLDVWASSSARVEDHWAGYTLEAQL